MILAVAAVILAMIGVYFINSARRRPTTTAAATPVDTTRAIGEARLEAQRLIDDARTDVLRLREASLDEISQRQTALEIEEGLLEERDRVLRDRNHHFNQHRHSWKERRAEVDAEVDAIEALRSSAKDHLVERAELDQQAAAHAVLDRVETELAVEHPDRVEAALLVEVDDAETTSRTLIVEALQRQDQGHADRAPRTAPIPLEGLDDDARARLVDVLGVLAEQTNMELGVDAERAQATLRGQDPIGREVARQASLEVVDRKLQVADVGPLVLTTRSALHKRVVEVGERALWEMTMEGRPELAELVGTLHYRFSYGQNALLHCQETGYLCGVLAGEMGLDQTIAREAGMLHDIGKAADHDVEGSHAIIGGELLRIFGTDSGIVHAVKAHHFDEEPTTDLAMLTICADAISASRPGARRDTLSSYLARLEQLQEIATRHQGVERAFPLQAGREVRILVKARSVKDAAIPALSHEIAREIEAEMQYPGVIKVVVIRETTATATAPAQVTTQSAAGVASPPTETSGLPGTATRRRRRGGRGRKKRTDGEGEGEAGAPHEGGRSDVAVADHGSGDGNGGDNANDSGGVSAS